MSFSNIPSLHIPSCEFYFFHQSQCLLRRNRKRVLDCVSVYLLTKINFIQVSCSKKFHWLCRTMSTRWLMIFFVLTTFILIDSNGLPANSTKNRQGAEGDSADNINYSNERLNSLSEVNNSKESTETRKIPTCLNQETTERRCKNGEISISTEKNYQYLINALSKIAEVRVSTSIRGPTSFHTKSSSKPNSEDTFNNTPNGELRRKNFHCHAIQDIYIPEMKEKIPSYACTFGENLETFILSSKRFFQDRRNSLHIDIDNDILRKLNSSTITPTNSQFNIIPAVLVLKHQHENYYIRNPQNFYD